MSTYVKTNLSKLIENQEVVKVLEWWNNTYEYKILDTENGLVVMDLQTGEIRPTDINKLIEFYINEIENKLYISDSKELRKDLDILKKYLE